MIVYAGTILSQLSPLLMNDELTSDIIMQVDQAIVLKWLRRDLLANSIAGTDASHLFVGILFTIHPYIFARIVQ